MKYLNPVKTIKYGLNNAVFFINSPVSVHSVSVRNASNFDRRNINLSIECPEGCGVFKRHRYVEEELSSHKKYGIYQIVKEELLWYM